MIVSIKKKPQSQAPIKVVVLGFLLAGIAAFSYFFQDWLTLEKLASSENLLREQLESHPVLFYTAAFLLYVAVAGLALPGAAALSLAYAWFIGFWSAFILISFASTLGATISFLLSRYFFGNAIQARFGKRLASINENLKNDGAFYLFSMRLIPAIPFFLINLLMGLTPISVRTFWWVSQLGMIPGTAVFVYAGSTVPSLKELAESGLSGIISPQAVVAFTLLGVFPFVVKRAMSVVTKYRNRESDG